MGIYIAGSNQDFFHPAIDYNEWKLYTLRRTASSGLVEVFLNGLKFGSFTATSGSLAVVPENGAWLAQEQDSLGGGFDPNQVFNGLMDEVRIYNRALSDDEILSLYQDGAVVTASSENPPDVAENTINGSLEIWRSLEVSPQSLDYSFATQKEADNIEITIDSIAEAPTGIQVQAVNDGAYVTVADFIDITWAADGENKIFNLHGGKYDVELNADIPTLKSKIVKTSFEI